MTIRFRKSLLDCLRDAIEEAEVEVAYGSGENETLTVLSTYVSDDGRFIVDVELPKRRKAKKC